MSTLAAIEAFQVPGPDDVPIQAKILNQLFVDDFAVPVFAPAEALWERSRAVFVIVWNTFFEFALKLNMEPGKTMLMPLFVGKGSAAEPLKTAVVLTTAGQRHVEMRVTSLVATWHSPAEPLPVKQPVSGVG